MKIGLALSGGGIRGIAHAGAIKALEENNIKIDIIGGTSSGSMIAVLYAMGYKPDEILNLFKKYAETIVKIDGKKIANEIKNFMLIQSVEHSVNSRKTVGNPTEICYSSSCVASARSGAAAERV